MIIHHYTSKIFGTVVDTSTRSLLIAVSNCPFVDGIAFETIDFNRKNVDILYNFIPEDDTLPIQISYDYLDGSLVTVDIESKYINMVGLINQREIKFHNLKSTIGILLKDDKRKEFGIIPQRINSTTVMSRGRIGQQIPKRCIIL